MEGSTTAVATTIPVILVSPEISVIVAIHTLALAQKDRPPQRKQKALSGAVSEAVIGCWLSGCLATFIEVFSLLNYLILMFVTYGCTMMSDLTPGLT